jgi:hypothetical protein
VRYALKENCAPANKNPTVVSRQKFRLRQTEKRPAAAGRGTAREPSCGRSRYSSSAQPAEATRRPPTPANTWPKPTHNASMGPAAAAMVADTPIAQRSYWIPGSYVTSNSMSAPSSALPRLRTLCTNSKNPR